MSLASQLHWVAAMTACTPRAIADNPTKVIFIFFSMKEERMITMLYEKGGGSYLYDLTLLNFIE